MAVSGVSRHKRIPISLLLSLALVVTEFAAAAGTSTEQVTPALGSLNQSGTPLFSTSTFTPASIGYQFTALKDIQIVSMGIFDLGGDGLTNPADVGIFSQTGELLRRVVIPPDSPLRGDFRYSALDSPLSVSTGTSLRVAHFVSTDDWVFRADVTDFNSLIRYDGSVSATASNPTELTFPDSTFSSRREYLGTDFEFIVVPEPAVPAMISLGACLLWIRRRSV